MGGPRRRARARGISRSLRASPKRRWDKHSSPMVWSLGATGLSLVRQSAFAVSSTETALLMVTHALRTRETAPLHVVAADLALARGDREVARSHARRALVLEPGQQDAQRALEAAGR